MVEQMLVVEKEQEARVDVNLSRKLLKKEQRLIARVQEEQEAEARALDRFQRAQKRLQRRRNRLERLNDKLALVRERIADLHMIDQELEQVEPALTIPVTPESTPEVDFEDTALEQAKQDVSEDTTTVTASTTEPETFYTTLSEIVQVATFDSTNCSLPVTTEPENTFSAGMEDRASNTIEQKQETEQELETSSPSEVEASHPDTSEQESVISAEETTIEPNAEAAPEIGIISDSIEGRVPTKPLSLEQEEQAAAASTSPDIQSAKEAWIAAESAMQNARKDAQGIAASISFLSQAGGLSNDFMEELVRKQADANRALVKAQDVARVAYERFVQAQNDAEEAVSEPVDTAMNTSGDHPQQQQENGAQPVVEENGNDQTARLHAIRLYNEW